MGLADRYAPGQDLPLAAYAGFLAAYAGTFGPLLAAARRRGRLPERIGLGDTVLLGLATHKLSRIVAKDWVTSPLRAPFAEYRGPAGGGEVVERARGHGLRRAIGDLVTCNFCVGPWVAGALVTALLAKPRATRAVLSTFTAVAISDFLHRAYQLLGTRREELSARREVAGHVTERLEAPR